MKGQLQCHNCGYGTHVEAIDEGEDVACENCGVVTKNVTKDDLQ